MIQIFLSHSFLFTMRRYVAQLMKPAPKKEKSVVVAL